jgi:hypothetical protein
MKIEDVKFADDVVLLVKEETVLKGKYFMFHILKYLINQLKLENVMAWKQMWKK